MADQEGMSVPSEVRELVSRCLAGQQGAMVALVDLFQARVFSLCFRMLGHRQDAEDVTQDSLVRAFRSLRRWDPEREFAPWLLAIAGNRCRTMLAARAHRPVPATMAEEVADHAEQPEKLSNLSEEVRRALDRLRPEYRQAFELFHEEQLSYAEISAALGCPLGTVKTWVHRARRDLIEQLKERGVFEEYGYAVREV